MPSVESSPAGRAAAVPVLADRPKPQASSALICLMASAWQRIFELQCQTALGVISGRGHEPAGSAVADALPMFQYMTGVLDICRDSSECIFGLLRAQIQGEHAAVDALAEAALQDFAMTSADAAQAARATLLTGIETVSDLTASIAKDALDSGVGPAAQAESAQAYPFLGVFPPRFSTIFPATGR